MQLEFSRFSLGVNDLEISERFYRDALGLTTERRGEAVEVTWPSLTLVLVHRPPASRGKFQFGFAVPSPADVDAWAARLRDHGAAIVSGPATNDGARRLIVLDPDDYEIEIYSAGA